MEQQRLQYEGQRIGLSQQQIEIQKQQLAQNYDLGLQRLAQQREAAQLGYQGVWLGCSKTMTRWSSRTSNSGRTSKTRDIKRRMSRAMTAMLRSPTSRCPTCTGSNTQPVAPPRSRLRAAACLLMRRLPRGSCSKQVETRIWRGNWPERRGISSNAGFIRPDSIPAPQQVAAAPQPQGDLFDQIEYQPAADSSAVPADANADAAAGTGTGSSGSFASTAARAALRAGVQENWFRALPVVKDFQRMQKAGDWGGGLGSFFRVCQPVLWKWSIWAARLSVGYRTRPLTRS